MAPRDIALALCAIVLWALNMVVSKIAMTELSPAVFTTLRLLVAIPFMGFIPRPKMPFFTLCIIGLFLNILNYLGISTALAYQIPAGIATILFQSCVFFGVALSYFMLNDRPLMHQLYGLALGLMGLVIIMLDLDPVLSEGCVFVLLGALSWGIGSTLIKKHAYAMDMSFMIWLGGLSGVIMLPIGLILEGPASFMWQTTHISWQSVGCILYACVGSMFIAGYILVSLLARYSAFVVNGFMILLPVVGSFFGYLAFDEQMSFMQYVAGGVIILGLIVNQRGPTIWRTCQRICQRTYYQIFQRTR